MNAFFLADDHCIIYIPSGFLFSVVLLIFSHQVIPILRQKRGAEQQRTSVHLPWYLLEHSKGFLVHRKVWSSFLDQRRRGGRMKDDEGRKKKKNAGPDRTATPKRDNV